MLQGPVDLETLELQSEAEVRAIVGDGQTGDASWWLYDPSSNTVSANPSAWYAVRGADGDSFAKLHVTDIQLNDRQISLDLLDALDARDVHAYWPMENGTLILVNYLPSAVPPPADFKAG